MNAESSPAGGSLHRRLAWTIDVRADPRLSALDKHLALTLYTYMDAEGRCYPGIETLARAMSVCDRSVQRHLHSDRAGLIRLGYLRIIEGGGRRRTHRYQALFPDAKGRHRATVSGRASDAENPDSLAEKGDSGSQNPGAPSPEQDREPEREPVSTVLPPRPANNDRSRKGVVAEDREALKQLVNEVADSDSRTYAVWAKRFLGHLDWRHFDQVHDLLIDEWRAYGVGANGDEPIQSEAAFVYRALGDFVSGYDSLPAALRMGGSGRG